MSTYVPSGVAGGPTATEGPGGLPPLQSFSNFPIFGPIAIGTFIGILGTGALIMGTIMFFDRYPIHKRRTRLLLFVRRQLATTLSQLIVIRSQTVVSLNVAQTVSDCSRLIKITIIDPSLTHFIDVRARPEEVLSPALSAAICTLVQVYLAHSGITFYRAGVAPTGRSSVAFEVKFWSICVLLALGIALGFGAGLGTAIYIRMLPNYIYASRVVDSDGVFPTLTTIWLSATAATDILVTAVIITQVWSAIVSTAIRLPLTRKKLKYSQRRRDKRSRAVWALVHLLAQSGLLVTALQIAALITYLKSHTSWSDFPMIFISKVYSLTLLASYCMPRSAMCEVDTGESTHDHDRPARSPPRRPTQPPLTPSRFLQSWRDHDVATITPATIRGNLNRHRNPSLDSHAVPLHPIDSGSDSHEQLQSPYSVTVGEKTSPRVMGMSSPWNRGAKNGGSGWRRYDHSRSDSDEAHGESTGKVHGVLDL